MRGLVISMPSMINEVKRYLNDYSQHFDIVTDFNGNVNGYDIVSIIGTDKFVITTIHKLNNWDGPVMTIGFDIGFLNSINLINLKDAVTALINGNYDIENVLRLAINIRGKKLPYAINEIAIFPAKSATTLEYSLHINNEYIWHDIADGIIISTPTGSTAYAMSAGGPLIHSGARVFEVVPVNSTNLARVPIVVPEDSTIYIKDLASKSRIEAIIDGSIRVYVGDEVKAVPGKPLKLVRFGSITSTVGRYEKKINLMSNMDLPPSAKFILKILEYEGQLTQKEITEKTMLPSRTVRNSINILMRRGLIQRQVVVRGGGEVIVYSLTANTRQGES
nr:MAG: ATP-NAD kinase [Vulcanisaeta sp. AZ3]